VVLSKGDEFFSEQVRCQVWRRKIENSGTSWKTNPRRAYRAFECFPTLPGDARTVIAAYRRHTGNPEAVKPSDTWSRWSSQFAWRERAAAYDDHIARVHRDAYVRAIEEEAERQARVVEQTRYRFAEMMTRMYEQAIENLERDDFWETMRPQDVINIAKLHLEAIVRLRELMPQSEAVTESDWTEDDDAELDEIMRQLDTERAEEEPEEGSEEGEEDAEEGEDSESDGPEEGSEETE
jgi:hypothetical protein